MTELCRKFVLSCIVFASISAFCNTHLTIERVEERELFKQAVLAYEYGNTSKFLKLKETLSRYPLSVYLEYYNERRYISSATPDAATAIRRKFTNSRFGEEYFSLWLRHQAKLGRWQRFVDSYEKHEDATMQCYYLRSLYATGQKQDAFDGVPKLWMVGESQPKACDPLFKVWLAQGSIVERYVEDRFVLALKNNARPLARYLLRLLKGHNRTRAKLFYDTHLRPNLVLTTTRYRDDRWGRKSVLHGLNKLLINRKNAGLVHSAWQKYRTTLSFSEHEKNEMEGKIAAARAFGGHISSTANNKYSPIDREQIATAAIVAGKWKSAMNWILSLTPDQRNEFKWQYWYGRVGVLLNHEGATNSLTKLSKIRTYYGFAAAHALGVKPAMNQQILDVREADQNTFRNDVRIARILELYAIGDLTNARREINWLKNKIPDEYLKYLVVELHQLGWYDQAIRQAGDGSLLDVLEIRFPMPFKSTYQKYADMNRLPVSLLFAVSRQESAFNERAISVASARGIMQLMPKTAEYTARKIGDSIPTRISLLDPEVSIRLGSHHLAELMEKYGHHRIIAAAAYNAGASNAARWLKNASGMDSFAWIEKITYYETRNYVKSILAFNQVYNSLLDLPNTPFIAPHEQVIP